MAGCRALTDNEVTLVMAQLKGIRDKTLFTLGLKTGLRISSLLSLKVEDVYQDGKTLHRVKVQRRNTKGKVSSVELILHPEAKALIVELCKYMNPQDYLFTSRNGSNKALSRHGAHKLMKEAFARAGIVGSAGQLGTHVMRKSFASKVHKALGNDLFKTQRALHHKSPLSTAAYLHVDQAEIDSAVLSA